MKINQFSKYIFWSYEEDSDLPEQEVIKRVLSYGEVQDLIKLSDILSESLINKVISAWQEKEKFAKRINFFQKIILEQ
ncbi:hypothetical protein L21SP5_02119 [Salinivirga cyanobacteriivorans]|uniref:Uncharacterized protein n=1 Tax=Salinivirga cyanobacteriivorans TaxID=1307839 RepID=A0A0S2I087_9BACT|nr:hypothetical protein [Salinivirga cyanobacteriivorans]ALO15752.1 hypothetical protein L21SP5_02119 [Salinivirga cyanobacteriivorans]